MYMYLFTELLHKRMAMENPPPPPEAATKRVLAVRGYLSEKIVTLTRAAKLQ